MSTLENFNKKQIQKVASESKFFDFKAGDTVNVSYRITEGTTTRIQNFEGVVIAKSKGKDNYNASFTVRKISHGVGVDRKFMLYSPLVEKIELVSEGIVRRGKLYYLRDLKGKSARIKKKIVDKNKNNNTNE